MSIKPKKFVAEITSLTYITKTVLEIVFKPISLDTFTFLAGQFINIEFKNTIFRAYSLASDPSLTNKFSIIVSVAHTGVGSNFFKTTSTKTQLTIVGPSGRFLLSETKPDEIVFLATKTGVAPFISMLHTLNKQKSSVNIKLYFGVRNEDEIFYINVLETFKKTLTNFDYFVCLSQPKNFKEYESNKNFKLGRITSNLEFDGTKNTHVYICGNPNMVEETVELAKSKNIPETNIFHEKFTSAMVK